MNEPVNILLVDDQPGNLDVLEAILSPTECRLVRARSADEALLAMLKEDFAAIVLDIRMPGIGGLELAGLIKQRKRTQHTPILFLTAHLIEESDALRGYGVGAVDYLSKPVNPEILRSKIGVFVDLFRKTRALAAANEALEAEVLRREQAQEALREANSELEARVQERTVNLTVVNQALRESEERLRLAMSASKLHAWEMDLVSRSIRFAEGAAEAFGFPAGSWDGPLTRAASMLHPDDRDGTLASFSEAAETSSDYSAEFRIVRPDGSVAWVINRGRMFRDDSGRPVRALGLFMDITDRKRYEEALRLHSERLDAAVIERTRDLERSHERLRLAERLASLGTLSAGLGHDMGNLLLPVHVRLECLSGPEVPARFREDVEAIKTSVDYLQRLASGLRMLALDPARRHAGDATELAAWWEDAGPVLKNALPRGIRLQLELAEGEHWAAMPRAALTQAIFNLVQNAGEAMQAAGSGTVTVWGRSEPGGVSVGVSDDGPGMPEDVKRRCMEPFFTTKTRGISTGLGLALVYGLVQDAGGSVHIESQAGKGTTFTLRLPAAAKPDASGVNGQGRPRLALVRLADKRLQAFAVSELQHLAFEVHVGQDRGPEADLVIVDELNGAVEFRDEATLVLLGTVPEGARRRVTISLAQRPSPMELRDAIRRTAAGPARTEEILAPAQPPVG
jgi:PAS domain S-box-containing protein